MFKKIKEVAEGRTDIFTVRCTSAWLERTPVSTIFLEVNDEMEVLTSSRERKEHFQTASLWLKEQIYEWENSNIQKITIADQEHPIEVLTGDTNLILVIEGKKYLYSVYRDIFPKGWLRPGGCSHSKEELFNPKKISDRELVEEVLIADIFGKIYRFSNLFISGFTENVAAWQGERALATGEIILLKAKELPEQKGDAQNMVIRLNGQETKIENITVMVDAVIASVSTCVYSEVILPVRLNELRLFDGEKLPNQVLLNRPVRLTDEQSNWAALFSRGDNLFLADWITPATAEKAIIPLA